MSRLSNIYRTIRSIDDASVDRALAAALPTADRVPKQLAALLLLQRNRPEGAIGLIVHFHLLDADLQQAVITHAADLFRPLREAAAQTHSEGPANAMRVIRGSLSTRLAYLVSEQLRRGTLPLQDRAAECLLHLAQQAMTDPRPGIKPVIDASSYTFLQSAIGDAVSAFGHHRHAAVLRAMTALLPRAWPDALRPFTDPQQPSVGPMRALARSADHAEVRRGLLWWLGVPALAESAVAGLRRCSQSIAMGEVLGNIHLLQLRSVRQGLHRVRNADTLWPAVAVVSKMAPHQQRGLAAWAAALPFDPAVLISRLARLGKSTDPATRLFALRRLLRLAADSQTQRAAGEAIAAYCADPEVALARIALWHLIRHGDEGLPKMLTKLVNSSHPQIRRLAGQRLGPLAFARMWESWPKLAAPRRLATSRALIKIAPDFHRLLGDKLAVKNRSQCVRALAMISELNQGTFFERALLRLAQEEDEFIASAAAQALGSASGPSAVRALEQALAHRDSRVRANAVEALCRIRSTQHVQRLVEIAGDDHNRPRANAIAALIEMRTADALHALRQMLDDHRPNHRTSALWLVDNMGLLDVACQVAEMSITDPNDAVKNRADRVIHDLMDQMTAPEMEATSAPPNPLASAAT